MKLNESLIENAKPKNKLYKMTDGHGLCLEVVPTGRKRWRFRYRFENKELMISLGVYPLVSLAEARERHLLARTQLMRGINPSEVRKKEKDNRKWKVDFESVAKEWFEKNKSSWTENHAFRVKRSLEANIFPWLGKIKITEITARELLTHLRRIESRGAIETAHRVKGYCGQIFRYGIANGRAERDITLDLKDALLPWVKEH